MKKVSRRLFWLSVVSLLFHLLVRLEHKPGYRSNVCEWTEWKLSCRLSQWRLVESDS